MAIGSSGPWEIAIDQTTSGRDRWFAQIEGPSICLYFEIPALKTIDQAVRFLSEAPRPPRAGFANSTRNGTLALGSSGMTSVGLIRDDEFTDRYFLVVESKGRTVVRLTVAGDDLTHLSGALGQVQEEIKAE
jgi:hypothetical protein